MPGQAQLLFLFILLAVGVIAYLFIRRNNKPTNNKKKRKRK